MGKTRARHNWKARQQQDVVVDRTEEQKIEVSIDGVNEDEYDDSNALVLPSKKRTTKTKIENVPKVKKLSKKQRKKLQRIVDQKDKKLKRAELLDALQKVQATEEEIALLTSTTEVYSGKSHKKRTHQDAADGDIKINSIAGSKKKRKEFVPPESDSSLDTSDMDTESEEEEEEEGSVAVEEKSEEMVQTNDTKIENAEKNSMETDTKESAASRIDPVERKPVVHIPVTRLPEVQESRLKLPILGEEQVLMEAIKEHPAVIICGETGSGKTTQVPQFLYEAGYAHGKGIIGVTEPRRVAAVAMSKRVAHEMGLTSREVSYQIRYEGNVTDETKINFMTDGVLLKHVQQDFLLSKFSVIIVDEAHERSVYTDILIGLLSRIVPLRQKKGNPLSLIIMSATLRVEDFTENTRLFKIPPPVMKVDARQYPVAVHFNKRTPLEDYVGEAFRKVCKIHRKLPEGGILLFVTGQQEVHSLCAKLRRMFPSKKDVVQSESDSEEESGPKSKRMKSEKAAVKPKIKLPDINLDRYSVLPDTEEGEIDDLDVDVEDASDEMDLEDDVSDEEEDADKSNSADTPLHVLPLYSLLSPDRQAKVFEPPPEGSRLCVIATNVAETSITIPNVKYVVDTGKVKTKFYDKVTGVSTFKVTWTSKASANQRAGRAGRTGPGHCYRLYSSAVFNDEFPLFSPPEIARRPVDDLILQMKDIGIDKVINFPFPTPPDDEALKVAEKLLIDLGALEKIADPKATKKPSTSGKKLEMYSTKLTSLGRAMASFPVAPRYGKMLALGHQHELLPYVIAIVAALSVQEIFVDSQPPPGDQQEKEAHNQHKMRLAGIRKSWSGAGQSLLLGDLMLLLKAVGASEYAGCTVQFCLHHGLRYKAMVEIRKLRQQLSNSVNAVISDANLILDPRMEPPNELQAKLLRQIVLAGLADHVARKMPDAPKGSEDAKKLKNAFQCIALEDPVFIHPASALYKKDVEYVVYQQIDETSKMYMKGVCAVEEEWLPVFAPQNCIMGKPLEDPEPSFHEQSGVVRCHMTSTFGPHFWPIRAVLLDYPDNLDYYKWFGRFFLEGKVCPHLKSYVKSLLSSPSIMVKSWAKLQPRTESLLQALVSERIKSQDQLLTVWKTNPKHLLNVYLEWVPQSLHAEITLLWPPL